ncbi:hypothetical protein [Marivita sp.]|jgi:hypothetical protein|uniref:hypothetical protein n=1 Tax=Marivita sp. TaxID=2003365 RepID=UPI003F6D575C
MTELTTSAPKTLIISNNMVEADDLTEILTGQGLGPVVHVRGVADAHDALTQSGEHLRLMLFGLSMHRHDVADFPTKYDASTCPLILIDGPSELSDRAGAGVLLRPYSTDDVLAALARLGFGT